MTDRIPSSDVGEDLARKWTVRELRAVLEGLPDDAPLWVLDVHHDGTYGDSFHVVNAYIDRFVRRAVLIVEPL